MVRPHMFDSLICYNFFFFVNFIPYKISFLFYLFLLVCLFRSNSMASVTRNFSFYKLFSAHEKTHFVGSLGGLSPNILAHSTQTLYVHIWKKRAFFSYLFFYFILFGCWCYVLLLLLLLLADGKVVDRIQGTRRDATFVYILRGGSWMELRTAVAVTHSSTDILFAEPTIDC